MTLEEVLSLKMVKVPAKTKPDSGVHYANGRYKVEFKIDGKLHYFGSFKAKQDAVNLADKVRLAIEDYHASKGLTP